MSLKASNSEKNLLLPVSDPPHGSEEKDRLIRGDEKLFRGSAMTKRGAYAALSYMACAVLLVLFNKAALSSYSFPSANVITLVQMVCSCCFLYLLRRWKVISFTVGESLTLSDNAATMVPMKTLRHTSPLAGTYLLYMLATMESVRGVNVPMYTTLRRTTVVFTMVVEYLLAGQKYTYSVVGSVGLIVLGAFIAGARDLSFDVYGYSIVFLSNVTTAIYLATIARIGKSSGLTSFGLMWCNGILCTPILLFWTFIRGDLEATLSFPHLLSPGFLVVMLCSCTLAFFLNYSIFLNTTLNSAVTQTICGNLKDLFTIGLGWMIFGGLPFDLFFGGVFLDIQVKKSATVAELKGAVEAVFSHMPQDGPGKISWLHVWWHFCLCYAGEKLVDDTDYIANFGIKDGDQLQFVRHVTTGYNVIRKQSNEYVVSSKLHSRTSSRSKSHKRNDQDNYNDIEMGRFQHHNNGELFMSPEPKMVVFLGGWFSHTKLASAGRMSINSLVRPSGSRPSLVRGFKNLVQLCREKRHYQKVSKKKRSIIVV